MTHAYDDIIRMERPVSAKHPPMPLRDRAAQFAPFAALTGYENVIAEAGRRTEVRAVPAEDAAAELDARLRLLRDRIGERPTVTVTWFVPDAQKTGGSYRTETAPALKLDGAARRLILACGAAVPLDDLVELSFSPRPEPEA